MNSKISGFNNCEYSIHFVTVGKNLIVKSSECLIMWYGSIKSKKEERLNILQNAEDAGLKWTEGVAENKSNCIKKYEQLKKKEVGLTLHAPNITEYLKTQRIPRGLRCRISQQVVCVIQRAFFRPDVTHG